MRISILAAVALGAAGCRTPPAPKESPSAATASEPAARSFDHRPRPGEKAVCPVAGEVFVVSEDTPVRERGGRWYALCCAGCAPAFDAAPDGQAKQQ